MGLVAVALGAGACVLDDIDEDGFGALLDCDDWDAAASPDGIEICDGIDNNCNGTIDEGVTLWAYPDADGDGHGAEQGVVAVCELGPGQVDVGGDCDDSDPEIHPGAEEVCDGVLNDCTGELDGEGGAEWITAGGSRIFTGAALGLGDAPLRLLTLDEPGEMVFCGGGHEVELQIDGVDVTLRAREGQREVALMSEGDEPVIRVNGGQLTLDGIRVSSRQLGFVIDENRRSTGISCHGAGSSVTLRNSRIDNPWGTYGSPLLAAWDGCTVDARDSTFELSMEYVGVWASGGEHRFVDSQFVGEEISSHGRGLELVDGARTTLRGVRFKDLDSRFGPALTATNAEVVVEPSEQRPTSFQHLTAGDRGAVRLERSTLTATDWAGVDISNYTDDTYGPEVVVAGAGSWRIPDGATFSCDDTGCGEGIVRELGTDGEMVRVGRETVANVVFVERWARLTRLEVKASLDEGCTATGFWSVTTSAPSRDDDYRAFSTRTWPMPPSSEEGWLDSGPIGVELESTQHLSLGIRVVCPEGADWRAVRGSAQEDPSFARVWGHVADTDFGVEDRGEWDEFTETTDDLFAMRLHLDYLGPEE